MIPDLLLALQTYADDWASGEFWDGLLGPFVDVMGLPLFAALVFVPIGLSYYLFQGSMIMPLIMLVLIGGVTIALAPNPVIIASGIAFILTLAGAGYMIYQYRR